MMTSNFFEGVPDSLPVELVEILGEKQGLRLERIVSEGHVTPEGEWYDQDTDEWVLLLRGAARLRIEGQEKLVEMKPGDYLLLPAHLRHRVEWTDLKERTFWLAIHLWT